MRPQNCLNQAKVGVAIVAYNGLLWLPGCLNSLRASSVPARIALVDNCSTDGCASFVAENFPEVEIFRSRVNLGFGIGNNIAISRLMTHGCEYIFLLNQDAHVLPDTIQRLTDFMDQNTKFAVASPLHCSPNEDEIDRKTYHLYLARYAADFLCDAAVGKIKTHYQIKGVNAAAWLVRASTFRTVGGFDPLFFMYGEDDDLIDRLEYHGAPFALVPTTKVVHLRESPRQESPKSFWSRVQRQAARARSKVLCSVKPPNYTRRLRARVLIAKGFVEPLARFLMKGDGVELVASAKASAQLLPELLRIHSNAKRLCLRGSHFLDQSHMQHGEWTRRRDEIRPC